MAYIFPNRRGNPEIPDSNIGTNVMLLKSYMSIADEYIKRIDDKVNILAIRLGLQPEVSGIDIGNNATVKRQSNICEMACETLEKTKQFTYTTTGLADILEEVPIDNTEIADIFIALHEFAITIKTHCDALFSMVNDLQENEDGSYEFPYD